MNTQTMTKPQNAAVKNEKKQAADARERLVRKASQGNRDALQELCRQVAPDILFSTSRILNNSSDAEDAAQEILIRMCMNIRSLRDPKAFGAWLGRIITNETRRLMHRNSRNYNIVDISEYLDIEEENEEYLPQEFALKEDDRKIVVGIVDRLPERQKEAVILHYYNNLSVTETAEAMDVRQQVASRYLKLAREKIKEELTKLEDQAHIAGRGYALLPIGPLMAAALHGEAGILAIAKGAWIHQALASAPALAGGAAKSAVIGAGITKATAVVLATAAISTGAYVGVKFSNRSQPEPPAIVEAVPMEYGIVFSGGDAGATQINPKSVAAYLETSMGGMEARRWRVEELESGETLYSGGAARDGEAGTSDTDAADDNSADSGAAAQNDEDDNTADSETAAPDGEGDTGGVLIALDEALDEAIADMYKNGETGEYVLFVRMEDDTGNAFTLSREFEIRAAP